MGGYRLCDAERCTKRFGEEAHVIEPGEAGEATHRIVREHVVYGVVQAAEEVRECRSVRWPGVRTPRVPVVRIVWVLQVSGAVQVVLLLPLETRVVRTGPHSHRAREGRLGVPS